MHDYEKKDLVVVYGYVKNFDCGEIFYGGIVCVCVCVFFFFFFCGGALTFLGA